jgi:hypothetical protein
MTTQTERVFDQALKLDEAKRLELILLLQDSLHETLPKATPEQIAELHRRAKFYDENPHLLLDGEEVMERLKLKLEHRRRERESEA